MKVLVFRHVPFEHLGMIAPALESNGAQFEYVDLYRRPTAPADVDISQASGLIFMGGPMSANDDLPYLRRELEIIQQAVAAGTPVLGVCLGAQLVAKALGSRVFRNPVKEIGWYPITWTPAAARDRLLNGLAGTESVFHWHGETFDLPAGAELLASSVACRNQAFRWGENVYGFQFHLEVTPEMIEDWTAQDHKLGDKRELDAPPDPQLNAVRLAELSRLVFGRWVSLNDTP
jgi:GMP synthase (glutamine-hydrolysing)